MTDKGRRQKDREKKADFECPEERKIDHVSGEVLPASLDFPGLPPDIVERVENAIYDFCTFECTPPIEDMSKERQARWAACCQFIGRRVFKGLLRESERDIVGRLVPITPQAVEPIIDIWLYYCLKFNKTPMVMNFVFFAGLNVSWLYDDRYVDELSPLHTQILKKVKDIEKHGIKETFLDGNRNSIIAMAILNNEHGYSGSSQQIQIDVKHALSAADLPKLSINK